MTDDTESLSLQLKVRLEAASLLVSAARTSGNKRALASALKELGNIERRPPQMREASTKTYIEAAQLYHELGLPLEEAWVKRHIGINHEYAERLVEAEKFYDEALVLFRQHARENTLNYANTVRYPAVIKNLLGKRQESTALWEEAVKRYEEIGAPAGVAEGAAWLTIFAIENGDAMLANEWFAKAETAARAVNDPETYKWIDEVKARLAARS